jgi:hypothetical protein
MREIITQADIDRLESGWSAPPKPAREERVKVEDESESDKEKEAGKPAVDAARRPDAPPARHMAQGATGRAATIAAGADKYKNRLLKYIPAEVVALYLALLGILDASDRGGNAVLQWVIFVFCLVGTYLYLRRVGGVSKQTQLVLSTVAFAVWAFSLGGPFGLYGWYEPLYGALLLPMFTFAIPIVQP